MFEETLRLYPSTIVQKETPNGGMKLFGYDVPAGTIVMVSCLVYNICVDEMISECNVMPATVGWENVFKIFVVVRNM